VSSVKATVKVDAALMARAEDTLKRRASRTPAAARADQRRVRFSDTDTQLKPRTRSTTRSIPTVESTYWWR